MTDVLEPPADTDEDIPRQSLPPAAARKLATTTKTKPLMREVTPRWLLRRLPWEDVAAGTYRVNRRSSVPAGEVRSTAARRTNKHGETLIELSSGHDGEPTLPGTFVDYETEPREYPLSVAQAVVRVHTRVADLYNQPMNQTEQQLRLTIEALRERQEHEMLHNRDFGLLHNIAAQQRVQARAGPPTPDDMDELVSRRRKSRLFLAHPSAIAAFGRECNRRGVYPHTLDIDGSPVLAWRNVPILPCAKIPIRRNRTSSILCMRTGIDDEGVVGLHQPGIPDEYEPSLSVRFMDVTEKAIVRYLVSAYYSVAVPVPDAVGVLENVHIGR